MNRRFRTMGSLIVRSSWLLLALLLGACGALPTNPPEPADDTRALSPVVAVAGAQSSPVATARPPLEPLRLVVLHTNDNWGETEPCG